MHINGTKQYMGGIQRIQLLKAACTGAVAGLIDAMNTQAVISPGVKRNFCTEPRGRRPTVIRIIEHRLTIPPANFPHLQFRSISASKWVWIGLSYTTID